MKREARASGWGGGFRRYYIPRWLYLALLFASYPTIVGALAVVNLFAVGGYAL